MLDFAKSLMVGNGAEVGNSTWYEPRRMPFQPRALRYAYEQAKKKGLSGQKLEAEMLRILKTTPHESAATESEMRKDVSEWVLHNGNPEDFVNNKGMETGNTKVINSDREFFKELAEVGNSKVGNSVPGSWRPARHNIFGYKNAQEKLYENYAAGVWIDESGHWNWEVSKDDAVIAGGISASEGSAKYSAGTKLESIIHQKLGNSLSDEEYWKRQYIDAARKKGIPEKEIQEFIKKIEKEGVKGVMMPIKNNASDDKFAYVMREFDEGKLKTPDGKVVTDPAQAKAIAYSESKKTENGLARARNAMAMNRKAIGSNFDMNEYGVDVGSWSWDWRGKAPDKNTMSEVARRIKDYVRQIDKNVPEGSSDERDEVFEKLDRFMKTQGFK